jgi:hypothetical protein
MNYKKRDILELFGWGRKNIFIPSPSLLATLLLPRPTIF